MIGMGTIIINESTYYVLLCTGFYDEKQQKFRHMAPHELPDGMITLAEAVKAKRTGVFDRTVRPVKPKQEFAGGGVGPIIPK